MKTITQEELDKVLELHRKYLNKEEGGVRANLSGAKLSEFDLSYADLTLACLDNADLRHTDLRGADLFGAYLRNADLRNADLRNADLRNADLKHAKLQDTVGNGCEIQTFIFEKYHVNMTKNIIQIGCEKHTHEEWFNFSDEKIEAMEYGALEWWKKHKEIINLLHKNF
jgi:hypothetical protein